MFGICTQAAAAQRQQQREAAARYAHANRTPEQAVRERRLVGLRSVMLAARRHARTKGKYLRHVEVDEAVYADLEALAPQPCDTPYGGAGLTRLPPSPPTPLYGRDFAPALMVYGIRVLTRDRVEKDSQGREIVLRVVHA